MVGISAPAACARALCLLLLAAGCLAADMTLFDFDHDFKVNGVPVRDVRLSLATRGAGRALRIATGHQLAWPGIDLRASDGHWDLSQFERVEMNVRNLGGNKVTVCLRVDNDGADGVINCVTASLDLAAGESGVLKAPLSRLAPGVQDIKLFGMRGFPALVERQRRIDPSRVVNLVVFVPRPKEDHVFEIDDIRATGAYQPPAIQEKLTADSFFPLIDEFGQYIHKEWPGKTHSEDELHQRREEETKDLAAHPSPDDWDKWGGWSGGPKLEATGFFYPAKQEGRWWLVDPDGRLFWSHGVDCVGGGAATPITDRKHWYRNLPGAESPLAKYYGRGNWAPHGYYQGKPYEWYDFNRANLYRKYGPDWPAAYYGLCHRRLRSWGLNTIGNWSQPDVCLQHKTPYVVAIHFSAPAIEGSQGYWGKFRDVLDPAFAEALRKRMEREKDRTAGDPWCIGYFVDNELGWGNDVSLSLAALTSPPQQAAKQVFIADLKARYKTIDRLNEQWGTEHDSWEELVRSQTPPDVRRAHDDLTAFYTRIAEAYFRQCREAVKGVAPDNLYLGCRFAWVNDRAVRAAANYCDVIGYNRYQYSVADFKLPSGVDRPVIIGEFHFGALDRGMFHPGLRPVKDQNARADAYRNYIRGALENPVIVGAHWFQFGDQATTGRGDGENYQIGFFDICDTPYVETREAVRKMGASLYAIRSGAASKTDQ